MTEPLQWAGSVRRARFSSNRHSAVEPIGNVHTARIGSYASYRLDPECAGEGSELARRAVR